MHAQIRWAFLGGLTLLVLSLGCGKKAKAARYLERANKFYAAQNWDAAEIEYVNAARLGMTNAQVVSRLGMIYDAKRDPQKAFGLLREAVRLGESDPDVRVKLGGYYLLGRQPDLARSEALAVLSLQPLHEQAMMLLSDTAVRTQDFALVRQSLERLPKEAAGKAGFHNAVGGLLLRQGDSTGAVAAFRKALTLDPKSTSALNALGMISLRNRDLAEADQAFRGVAEAAAPKSMESMRWADFKLQTGDREGAKLVLTDMTQKQPDFALPFLRLAELAANERQYSNATRLAQRALELDPANGDVQFLLSRLKLTQGNVAAAVPDLERLAGAYPRSAPIHYQLGLAYLGSRETAKAEASFKRAITLNTNYSEAILMQARLEIGRGNFTRSIPTIQQLIERQPRLEAGYLLLASAYQARGTPEDALTTYRALARVAPTNAVAPFQIGLLLRQKPDLGEARKSFERTLQLVPGHLPAIENLISMDLQAKNVGAALQRANEAVARFPTVPQPLLLVARIHASQRDYAKARETYEKALALDRNFQPAYAGLAQIHLASGNTAEARKGWEESVARNPKDVTSWMHLAALAETSRDYPKAAEIYEKVLALQPQSWLVMNNLAYVRAQHLNQLDPALAHARKARELAPVNIVVADTLGWVHFKRGDYPAALDLLEEAVQRLDQAAEKLADAESVYAHLGLTQYMLSELDLAQATFRRALSSGDDFPERVLVTEKLAVIDAVRQKPAAEQVSLLLAACGQDAKDPFARHMLGDALLRLGKVDEAEARYNEALALSPRSIPVMLALAALHGEARRDAKMAQSWAQKARQVDPDDLGAAAAVGRYAWLSGDGRSALGLLQDATRRGDTNAGTWYYLAHASFGVGQLAEAKAAANRAATLAVGSQADMAKRLVELLGLLERPEALGAHEQRLAAVKETDPEYPVAAFLWAMIQETKGKVESAEKRYATLAGEPRNQVLAAKQLALLYARRIKDDAKAAAMLAVARRTLPNDRELIRLSGELAYRKGDFISASRSFNECIRLGSNDPELHYYAGLSHFKLKQNREAKEALQRVVTLQPSGEWAGKAKVSLAEIK